MSIPLYFAADCKEFLTAQESFQKACTGFGINADGSPRIPQMAALVKGLVVIDDATLPETTVPGNTYEHLVRHCNDGCFFDFMRKPTQQHVDILKQMQARLPKGSTILIAENFLRYFPSALPVLSCATPCNHWKGFASQAARRYSGGWCLELIPWKWLSKAKTKKMQHKAYLPQAMCCMANTGGVVQYYDTPQTIKSKILVAEQYGCRAAIGLYHELLEVGLCSE